jgi:hypothetical protein
MEYPIFIKSDPEWLVKVINRNELLEIKEDRWEDGRITYSVQTYDNRNLVSDWLEDLRNNDATITTEEEFLTLYFRTLYQINAILGG